ncbi:MAG: hypothetical protein EA356_17655 [Geminicoccaceae bacterium]|nr:MAG: hypothetical protein EA356_17655 [Geminicoccaceae bacterium]
MTVADVVFRPLVPEWLLTALAVLVVLAILAALLGRLPAAAWRLPPLALLLLVLANPTLLREERDPVPDIVVLVEDASPSMAVAERPATTAAVLEALQGEFTRERNLEIVPVTVGGGAGGTELIGAVERAMVDLDRRRLAGVVIVSDGQVHDVPREVPAWARERPVHLILPGAPDETDRRLALAEMPTYAMVGERQSFVVRFDDEVAEPARLTIRQNGEPLAALTAQPGQSVRVPFTLDRAGETVFEIEVEPREGEISDLNNTVVAFVTGVRDRLRVLLVSGEPYPGLRVWRNLLKADPAVDLVHFTILRPPEKQDGTPVRELALIAFPVRELFELKLNEFDLIIFDRYARRGLLPLAYFDNVARYVEQGGALLIGAGPGFAAPLSLARTPLERVLPALPNGTVHRQAFVPTVTELGQRHPVTEGLAQNWPGEWGPWFRAVGVQGATGQVVMRGVGDEPLLVLDRVGEGRVAQLLSDQAWLWARGFEGGGPQATLLRRLVHWLMAEPELEEERLVATPFDDRIELVRTTLDSSDGTVQVVTPSGERFTVPLAVAEDGRLVASVPASEPGLYRFEDGEVRAFAAVRPMSPRELADLRASAEPLAPLLQASGGQAFWTERTGIPQVRRVAEDRSRYGRGWMGLVENDRYRVVGSAETTLFPAWLALLMLVGTQVLAWWREGRS